MLERGRAHPILGPLLLIALVLMLALLVLHGMEDGLDAATEVEAFCLAIAMFLGLLLLERLRRQAAEVISLVRGDRGPPVPRGRRPAWGPRGAATGLLILPLRR